MIEGSLSDVSLPGLLQFLATESNKSFSVQLLNGAQKGEVLVCDGEILAANFGLLEGNDALTEFLFWSDGTFSIERLAQTTVSAENCNLKIALKQANTFADQMLFLQKSNVGLNTEIVPSPKFGTQEWQEALQKQPLYKEDYVVLGWVTDGRTMRQAMREFNFDVVQATSSLFRLLSTGSVDSIRPSLNSILEQIEDAQASAPVADDQPVVKEISTAGGGKVLEGPTESGKKKSELKSAGKNSNNSLPVKEGQAEPKPKSKPEFIPQSDPKSESKSDSDFVIKKEPEPELAALASQSEPATKSVLESILESVVQPSPELGQNDVGHSEDHRPAEVITSDSLPAVGSPEFMELMAQAQKASGKADETKIPQTTEFSALAATSVLAKTKSESALSSSPISGPVSEPVSKQESKSATETPEQEAEKKSFDIRRTDPLPLVAIDIERLFQTSFHVAPFGQVALNNDALDEDLKKIVSAFKTGKTFINVATEGGHGRDPAQVLHTCKYALERGYIDPPDQVVSLTADLLLGRVELEQYLLQRRRLNGDELRDVVELARQKGMKLVELLVKMGFMTESDWDRLTREKERFAPR